MTSETLDDFSLSDISGELIQSDLQRVAQNELNSTNVKFYTKHGSKKGANWCLISLSNKLTFSILR